jgi:hypothetical protein
MARVRLFGASAVIALGLSACMLINPNRQSWIYSGSPDAPALLAYDSLEIRRLPANEDAREEQVNDSFWRNKPTQEDGIKRIQDMSTHPERYPPGRQEFVMAMTNMPGFSVPSKSYFTVVESSKSRCGRMPFETLVYVPVPRNNRPCPRETRLGMQRLCSTVPALTLSRQLRPRLQKLHYIGARHNAFQMMV